MFTKRPRRGRGWQGRKAGKKAEATGLGAGLTAGERAMLLWLYGHGKSALARDIAGHGVATGEIDRLLHLGLIERHGRNRWRLAAGKFVTGVFSRTDKGFGFVKVAGQADDIFIPARKVTDAWHGDTVLVALGKLNKSGEGEIVGVVERRRTFLAGICRLEKRRAVFLPEDGHYPEVLPLAADGPIDPEADGQMVLAELLAEAISPGRASVFLREILGDPDSAYVQARLVILAHELPVEFPQAALDEAAAMPEPSADADCPPDRCDLRQIFHITIDGDDAKDFDDAIAVERRGDGFRLYVSIADVGHYVRPGGALDTEARKRGTSIYFPGLVIPMLPERLSNDLCSLRPGEPRFCLTATLDFSATGELLGKSFCRSLIVSARRCTYAEAAVVLAGQDVTEPWQRTILVANELAVRLRRRREERGAINLTIAEPVFTLDAAGHVASLAGRQAGAAQQLIEECMLAANMAVAEELTARNRAFLYRIHEVPDEEKTENFYQLIRSLGLNPPPPALSPAWFHEVLHQAEGAGKEYVIGNLLLRTLRQARYAPENAGHFALAAACYCHFTSPIRRYPDLLVHRALTRLFAGQPEEISPERRREEGDWLSSRERLAITVSREMNDRLRVIFMADRLGETFAAVIAGFSQTMIFIDIAEPPVTGAVALDTLPEYYFYDREKQRLTGELSHRIFTIGDTLAVRLIEADRRRRHLNFVIEEDGRRQKGGASGQGTRRYSP